MELIAQAGQLVNDPVWDEATRKDLFFRSEACQLLYGNNWTSVAIRDGERSFSHVYACSPISDTGLYDIEPFLGYSGPVVNTDDPGFLCEALDAYSDHCRSRKIVAELIRFNPLIGSHSVLAGKTPRLRIIQTKPLVYIQASWDEEKLFAQHNAACRRKIRVALRSNVATSWIKAPDDKIWDRFRSDYRSTMERLTATEEWHFDDAFFDRLRASPLMRVGVLTAGTQTIASIVFLVGGACAYSFLAGMTDEASEGKGIMNLLYHAAAQGCARAGASWLCVGGGRTSADNDELLLFKQSLSKCVHNLPLGFLAHDPAELQQLYDRAAAEESENASLPLFLRYRCARRFAAGRMTAG
jgi:hypothetical protein